MQPRCIRLLAASQRDRGCLHAIFTGDITVNPVTPAEILILVVAGSVFP